jgi:hypothetical protein
MVKEGRLRQAVDPLVFVLEKPLATCIGVPLSASKRLGGSPVPSLVWPPRSASCLLAQPPLEKADQALLAFSYMNQLEEDIK